MCGNSEAQYEKQMKKVWIIFRYWNDVYYLKWYFGYTGLNKTCY